MSGFAGIFHFDGKPVARESIQRMTSALRHRGPHDEGIWTEKSVGLGHVLLHTTPESLQERQPSTIDGSTRITADARIDNRTELIAALFRAGQSFDPHDISDPDLILHAYHAWGEDCVFHLLGVFAFGIWDKREQKLFCARDPLGIKPFVYHQSAHQFVFASEAKGVLAAPDVPQKVYEPRIADYLLGSLEGLDDTVTFFEDVYRLPPAHRLVLTPDAKRKARYWTLEPSQEIRLPSDEAYVEAFREHFAEAVRCRLRVAGPAASMLSGGVDSSAVVAVAQQILAQQGHPELWTFSAVSDTPDDIETRHIRAVLAHNGTLSHQISPSELETVLPELNRLLFQTDDLFDHYVFIPQVMYALASQHGVNVLLTGLDGDGIASLDDLFLLAWLLRNGQFRRFRHELFQLQKHHYVREISPQAIFGLMMRTMFVPESVRRLRQTLQPDHQQETWHRRGLDPDFARRVDVPARIQRVRQHTAQHNKTTNEQQAMYLRHPQYVAGLERYDRVAALYGIEPRHPLLDRRVVEFFLALPWNQKMRSGWSKITLRQAMVGHMPESVCWREGRQNLATAFIDYYLRQHLPKTDNDLSDLLNRVRPFMDVQMLRMDFRAQKESDNINIKPSLWNAMMLANWHYLKEGSW